MENSVTLDDDQRAALERLADRDDNPAAPVARAVLYVVDNPDASTLPESTPYTDRQ